MHYLDLGENIFGLRMTKQPAPEIGICVPTEELIHEFLSEFQIDSSDFNFESLNDEIINDVSTWFEKEKASPRGHIPESIELIENKLRALNLSK